MLRTSAAVLGQSHLEVVVFPPWPSELTGIISIQVTLWGGKEGFLPVFSFFGVSPSLANREKTFTSITVQDGKSCEGSSGSCCSPPKLITRMSLLTIILGDWDCFGRDPNFSWRNVHGWTLVGIVNKLNCVSLQSLWRCPPAVDPIASRHVHLSIRSPSLSSQVLQKWYLLRNSSTQT